MAPQRTEKKGEWKPDRMATHVHSEVKELVVRARLRTGSRQMSEDGECLQIRMRHS